MTNGSIRQRVLAESQKQVGPYQTQGECDGKICTMQSSAAGGYHKRHRGGFPDHTGYRVVLVLAGRHFCLVRGEFSRWRGGCADGNAVVRHTDSGVSASLSRDVRGLLLSRVLVPEMKPEEVDRELAHLERLLADKPKS